MGRVYQGMLRKLLLYFEQMDSHILDSPLIPAHIGTDTLAVVISYSGNTWETLDVLAALTQKFIPTIVIGHGGRAIEIAEQKSLPFILVPASMTPRTALGVFLGFLATLFDAMGILSGRDMVSAWIKDAEKYIPVMVEGHFYKDFLSIVNGYDFFHIWGVGGDSDAVAYRATTQFNENGKLQAVFNSFPELCHNLLVGFEKTAKNPVVVLFSTDFLPAHLSIAIDATSQILHEKRVILYKPPVLGDTFVSQLFCMILWADFASYHVGTARGVDVMRVAIIEDLKKQQKLKGIK